MYCDIEQGKTGSSVLGLSKHLGISQPTASRSVKRGQKLAVDKKLDFMA